MGGELRRAAADRFDAFAGELRLRLVCAQHLHDFGVERRDDLLRCFPEGQYSPPAGRFVTGPALFRNLRFDPITDIQPVAAIAEYPYAIVINTHLPVKSVRDLIKLAQKNAGRLNASAGGIGTRLSVELFKIRNNIRVEVISYSGSGQAALAVATGETQLAIMDTSPFLPFLATGRVRLLAVAGDRRLPSFPDTPTTAEAGLPDYKAGTTAAVYVAGRTPAVIVQKLSAAINHVISLPEVREQLQKLGGNSAPASADEFTQWYRREIQLWKDIVARAQIPPLD